MSNLLLKFRKMFRIVYIYFLCQFCVYECAYADEADWQGYSNEIRNANREEVIITNFTADDAFKVDADVKKWVSLSIGPISYSVGLMESGLVVLSAEKELNKNKFEIKYKAHELNKKPCDVILREYMPESYIIEILVIVAFEDHGDLEWYKIKGTELNPFWTWKLSEMIIHLNAFTIEGKPTLLVSILDGYIFRVILYNYQLKDERKYWVWTTFSVDKPVTTSAFNKFKNDFFLTLPDERTTIVFKYQDYVFVPFKFLKRTNVESIVSFEIGFKSFLAIGGPDAAIYEFVEDGLKKKRIFNSNLEDVDFWLPIPLRTHRDEVVILAQRSIDYTSHRGYAIEIITYNGVKFEEHEDIPCSHFGEQTRWLTCLSEDGKSIVGSSYIFASDAVGLIVPGGASSFVFMINYSVKEMPDPLEVDLKAMASQRIKLQEVIDRETKEFEDIKDITKDFEALVASHRRVLSGERQNGDSFVKNLLFIGEELKRVKERVGKIIKNQREKKFDKIILNGKVEVKGECKLKEVVVENIDDESAEEIFADIVRKDSPKTISGNKIINNLNVQNIVFDKVNGIDAGELMFKNESTIKITGDLTIHGPAKLENLKIQTAQINGIDLVNEIVDMRSQFGGTLNLEKVKVLEEFKSETINDKPLSINKTDSMDLNQEFDSAVVLQNLTVSKVNGDDLNIFINQLCMTNVKCYIPGKLRIDGDITVDKASVTYLNNLKFPEEFIFRQPGPKSITITGRKTFRNYLVGKEVTTRGTVDGIDTRKLITLSTDQKNIPGNFTFKDIEVAEQLNVTGKIVGEHIDKFLPNPTLQHTKNIKSNVNFKKLEVDGNIIVESDFNGNNFEAILNDIVFKDDEEANILSRKNFPEGFTIKENLEIESNSINDVHLDSLVTKDTDQILNITILKGDVIAKNVVLGGKFDGNNITQMDQDLVKLSGTQYISSTLIFKDDIEAENFEITETLNNIKVEKYLQRNSDEIETGIIYEDIEVDNVTVEGHLTGNISEIDFRDFRERYLSFNNDQIIDNHYDILDSVIDNVEAERINGEDYNEFFKHENIAEKIKEMANNGQLKVKDLYVNGSLQVDSINEKNKSYWLPNDDLRDTNGKYKENITIKGDITFDTLEINRLSSVNWSWFNQQLIRKDEVSPVITAPSKMFLEDIFVEKLIETKKINGIPIENILTKQGMQIINSPIIIKGNVTFKERVNILENMNNAPLGKILENLVIENETYYIKDDVMFLRSPNIYNLEVDGLVNGKDITEHLSNIAHLDKDITFTEEIVFEYHVEISGNMVIEGDLNGIDLAEFFDEIVLITSDTEIEGPVAFKQPVVVKEYITIEKDLTTSTLYGVDLQEWKNNCVNLYRGMVPGTFGFDEIIIRDILYIKYLNGVDMNSFIPLRSNQSIDYLEFEEATSARNISVLGSVNGYNNLSNEFEITAMIDKDEEIKSNIVFNDVILVRENLFTPLINGKEVSKIVTTDTDQNLTSAFNFKTQCKIESDLHVHGLVNGVDVTVWQKRNVKTDADKPQNVYNDWNISRNFTFHGGVTGNSLINGLNLTKVMKDVDAKKNYKYSLEHALIEDYKNMCIDVSYLHEALKKQIYKFKYFEEFQTISLNNQVQLVHYFQFKDNHYLLINEDKCSSQIFVFNRTGFDHLDTVRTGHISQVVEVKGDDKMYLVTRDVNLSKKCETEGTNVWHFDGNTLELHYNIDEQDLLQESIVPFTFYGWNKKQGVIEFKVIYNVPRKYRKWNVFEENVAFVPRGLKTGLSLRTGHKIIFLDRSDPVEDNYSPDTESIIIGKTNEVPNDFLPGRNGGDLVVTKIGIESARKNLLAVATHEETSVRGRLDFVKIYSDIFKGKIFHKVPAYMPSSLLSIEFDQGETFLVFLENERILQVYEYKGIEGFKHRSSAKVEGSKLFLMDLPIEPYLNSRKAIGIVQKNKITILKSVMLGNRIREDLKCDL